VHDGQINQSSDRAVGSCGKDEKRFDGVVELDEKREIDADERYQKYHSQIKETVDLLRLFASDFELVARRQTLLEIIQFRLCGSEDFGGEHGGGWKAQH
jgi:hypothetical protein